MTIVEEQLKSALIEGLGYAKSFPTKMTDPARVRRLISMLRPIDTDRPIVRLGPMGDGGYLLPDDLADVRACFSPGVSFVSGFERDCAERGMDVFLADRSVDGPAEDHPRFRFTKKFVGVTSNAEFMTLDEWVDASLPEKTSDLLLQIDIEGYEYEVIMSASPALMRRFRIVVAEFHDLHLLWSEPFFALAGRAFEKLLQTHSCIHIHPNNCAKAIRKEGLEIPRTMEFTFLRHDRIRSRSYRTDFPHPLDCDNTNRPPVPLPACWYRGD